MPIAELFLSKVIETLLSELPSHVLSEYARINGISEKLNNWKQNLQTIQTVVDSAEERQIAGNSTIHHWLADLRDVAYDMEDLLDHFNVESKQTAFKAQTQSAKLTSCLIACCSKFDPRTLFKYHRMANEIEEVDRRMEKVMRQKEILRLDENFRSSLSANSGQPRFTNTTSLSEPKFVGREKHMAELLDRLTRIQETQDSVRPFTVLSIVGMGGIGKTTMAQQLYNHESVSNAFKLKAWACVSAVFDRVAIMRSVLQGIDPSSSCEGKDLNWHQTSLKQQLSEKKFLIVLDDVWTENYDELESLFKPFYSGSSGSMILLTTRNRQVAKLAGDRDPKELDLLSTTDCLSLLAYHAIDKDSFDSLPHLKDVAVKLAKKCKGLPLAVKTIGGLLRFESNDEQWQKVLVNGIWMGEGGQENIPPALKLSYVYLPIHLKRCFAACALFPKDYEFEGDELVQMWIVQGLLRKETAKTYRDVGFNHLGQLVDRSLLQKAGDKKTRYCMHDLINDLAKSVVGITYFSSDENRIPSNEETLANVRHAAMVVVNDERIPASKVDVYHLMKKLRTFMPFLTSTYHWPCVWVSKKVLHDLIMGMKHLRILSFRYFCIREVPDLFGKLKLLRSLDFSYTEVEVLPESICDLVKLQYLLLRGCNMLKKLPRNIHKLTSLLHLDITDTYRLEGMPPHIGSLTNLEILSSFVVGKEAGQELKELGKLKCLQGELHIHNLLAVNNVEDAKIANIHGKEGVSKLSLDWRLISRHDEHQLELLNHLQPPRKIESLGIYDYGGTTFPSWFGNSYMENVVRITLADCTSVESLPPFGRLPSLESLYIRNLSAVSMIGDEFYGTPTPFRSLRSLSFDKMIAWVKWSSSGICEKDHPFPCLRKLTLQKCPELKRGLPGRLDSLFELKIRDCPFLSASGGLLSLSSLGKLHFEVCNDGLLKCLIETTCMTEMFISNVPQLIRFDGRFSSSWVALEELRIERCQRFKSFEDEYGREPVPPKLKKLEIKYCEDIERLPNDLSGLISLNEMTVSSCHKLSSFPIVGLPPALSKVTIKDCPSLSPSQFLSMRLLESLVELTLSNLEGLMSIEGTRPSQSLRNLSITGCSSLTTIPDSLPFQSLWNLSIRDCRSLTTISDSLPFQSLRNLSITDCRSLTTIPGSLPSQYLRNLSIIGCGSLTTIPDSLQYLSALSELSVWNCEALEMDCFPALPCNLVVFKLVSCPKVKSLPQDMHNLTSLKHLDISSCDGIKCLPRGGLPPNLEYLRVGRCRMTNQPLEEWGLAGLTSLREFHIGGELGCADEMVSFPSSSGDDSDAWRRLLPSSLIKLSIQGMEKVKRLSCGLRAHLSSLQELLIIRCKKMRELPKEGLPDSLEYLAISDCHLLEERCKEPNGDYWKLIQLIPRVSSSLFGDLMLLVTRMNRMERMGRR